MLYRLLHTFRDNVFLIIWPILWILLWVTPWATWLDSLPWIGLGVSIIIFAAPGMGISLLLAGKRLNLLAHFTSGLAFSVLLVGSLGLLGRVFNLPFSFIKPVFALTGLIILMVLLALFHSQPPLYQPKRLSITTLALLILMFGLGIVINFQSKEGGALPKN